MSSPCREWNTTPSRVVDAYQWLASCWVSSRARASFNAAASKSLSPPAQGLTDEQRVQDGHRPGIGDRAEPTRQPAGRTDPGRQPAAVDHPCRNGRERCGILRILDDLAQIHIEQRIGAEVGEQLKQAAQQRRPRIHGAEVALRVVPAPREPTLRRTLPAHPRPQLRPVPDSPHQRSGQLLDRERPHPAQPSAANARAAASTRGPATSNSASRSSRAGATSPRRGSIPWNQAATTAAESFSASKAAA